MCIRDRKEGSLRQSRIYHVGHPKAIIPLDVNGDKKEDLLIIGDAIYPLLNISENRSQFMRGDANTDGRVDLSDAIFLLAYLFSRGESPSCLDAADANNDGSVAIADPIAILAHLFAGAGDLPEPFGSCGTDPLEGGTLGCEVYYPCM